MNCLTALSGHAANARCSTVAPRRREGGICTTGTHLTCSQIRAHAHTAGDFFACAAPETVLALHFRPQRKITLTPLTRLRPTYQLLIVFSLLATLFAWRCYLSQPKTPIRELAERRQPAAAAPSLLPTKASISTVNHTSTSNTPAILAGVWSKLNTLALSQAPDPQCSDPVCSNFSPNSSCAKATTTARL